MSASWTVPSTAVSGLYLAHLKRDDTSTGNGSLIPFVVRNDASHSDILYQTDDETMQAYNTYGGNSLYTCADNCPPGSPNAYKGASKVSYNRPWHTALDDSGRSWFMYAEYPMIRFLEENGYDVSYTSGVDVSQPGYASTIEQHKVFLSAGHDEYWTAQQRANVTAARDAGVNLAFFSGNEVFWKTRLEPSIDGSNTPNRTLVTYKETHYDATVDPQDPPTWTGTWMDPRFSPPGDGGNPQNALTGQLFDVNSGTTDITVPSQYSKLRFWRNTRVASLGSGQSTTLDQGVGTLGYEWDVDADNGFRPPGLMDMSSTTDSSAEVFTDYGSTTQFNSTATHHLTLYRAASGALVFGAGTVQWAWGLDNGLERGNHGFGHAAGHGEPARRHGRAAGHTDVGADGRHRVDRHDRAHLDDHLAVAGRYLLRWRDGDHQRHRYRRGRWCGRRGGGVHRRREHLAPGHHHVRSEHLRHLELFVDRPREPHGDHQDPGGRRQRQPGAAGNGHHGQRELPLLDLGHQRHPRDHRLG